MKFTAAPAPSRRGILKAAGAIAAGIAAPAVIARPRGLCRLSGSSDQIRGRQYAGRAIRHCRPHRCGGAATVDRQDLHHRESRRRRRQYRHGICRPCRSGRLHDPARDQRLSRSITGSTIRCPTIRSRILSPVSELAGSPNIFVVKPDLPAKTMKDFVALARTNSEKFNASVPPIGTTPQLQIALLKIREKLPNLEEVVFKGGGDAIEALLAGTVQLCSGSVGAVGAAYQSRRFARSCDLLRGALARSAGCADHDRIRLSRISCSPPTVCCWRRPRRRRNDVKWLEAETLKVLATPDMKDKLFQAGFLVRPKGADALWERMTKEMKLFKDIIDQGRHQKALNCAEPTASNDVLVAGDSFGTPAFDKRFSPDIAQTGEIRWLIKIASPARPIRPPAK